MRYLGLDFGHRKIGLALSDREGDFSYPHSVIQNNGKAISIITDLVKQEEVENIVIGDTRNLKGMDNDISGRAREFAAELGAQSKKPIIWQTEVFSSREAERVIGDDKLRDARAAAIILKSFLEKNKGG